MTNKDSTKETDYIILNKKCIANLGMTAEELTNEYSHVDVKVLESFYQSLGKKHLILLSPMEKILKMNFAII